MTKTTRGCGSCEMLSINGRACHELGCPDAERGQLVDCPECGSGFVAEARGQKTCSHSCWVAYIGTFCGCEECNPIEDQPEDGPTAEDERGWDAREYGEPILPSLVSAPEARLNGKVTR